MALDLCMMKNGFRAISFHNLLSSALDSHTRHLWKEHYPSPLTPTDSALIWIHTQDTCGRNTIEHVYAHYFFLFADHVHVFIQHDDS